MTTQTPKPTYVDTNGLTGIELWNAIAVNLRLDNAEDDDANSNETEATESVAALFATAEDADRGGKLTGCMREAVDRVARSLATLFEDWNPTKAETKS